MALQQETKKVQTKYYIIAAAPRSPNVGVCREAVQHSETPRRAQTICVEYLCNSDADACLNVKFIYSPLPRDP
eukprot:564854-Pyramimonas_sp.AAC.1